MRKFFKCQKFSLRVLLSICLIFCQFQPSVTYKKVTYKRACNFKGRNGFYFRELDKEEFKKEIHKLNTNKASQHSDIPTKIIKSNSDIFNDFLEVSSTVLEQIKKFRKKVFIVTKFVLLIKIFYDSEFQGPIHETKK